jgi:hypothetical protein
MGPRFGSPHQPSPRHDLRARCHRRGQVSRHGQGLLYTGGEFPRLMRSAPPQKAALAEWMTEPVLDAAPVCDRRPGSLEASMEAWCPVLTQSVWDKTRPLGCLALCGPANHTDSDTPRAPHCQTLPVNVRPRPRARPAYRGAPPRYRTGRVNLTTPSQLGLVNLARGVL